MQATVSSAISSSSLVGTTHTATVDPSYTITPAADATVTFTASGYDTILAIHEADCEFGTVLDCNDDNDPPGSYGSQFQVTLDPGIYYLVVDGYSREGKRYMTVAIGCTGGQHRSVYFAERLEEFLRLEFPDVGVRLFHREEPYWPSRTDGA